MLAGKKCPVCDNRNTLIRGGVVHTAVARGRLNHGEGDIVGILIHHQRRAQLLVVVYLCVCVFVCVCVCVCVYTHTRRSLS